MGGGGGEQGPRAAARPSEDQLRLCPQLSWSVELGVHPCLVAGCKSRVNFGDTIVISQLI